MSNDALNWGWTIKEITPLQKLIAIALADYANKEGYCWPSNKSLAERCNVSVRTVQRNLKVLEKNCLVMIEPRERKDGSSSSNGYLLAVPVKVKVSQTHDKSVTPSKSDDTCIGGSGDISRTIIDPLINSHTLNLDLNNLSSEEIPPEVLKSFRDGVSSGNIKNKAAYLNTLLSNHIPNAVIDNLLDDKPQPEIYDVDNTEGELINEIKHFENLREIANDNAKNGFDEIISELKVKLSKL